jgi:hypothetical protein
MTPIEAALAAIKLLGPTEKISYRQIARDYGCSPAMLARRHQHVMGSCSTKAENQQTFHPQQELELLGYIERLMAQDLPPTQAMMRNLALQIAQREVGVHWVDCYVQQHQDKLISKCMMGIDNSCHKADSGRKYSLYFSLLHKKIGQYHVEARYIYNMDEKGFMLGAVGRSKRIFSKASYEDGKRRM